MSPLSTEPPYPQELKPLPDRWVRAQLDQIIANVHTGFSSGQHSPDPSTGVPHIRPMNITRDGALTLEGMLYVPDINDLRTRRGDVLFNNTNSRELVGKTAAMDLDETFAFSNHITCITPRSGVAPRFLAYQLHYLWASGYFGARSKQHVNQASISMGVLLKSVPIALPPSDEQLRIVAALDGLLGIITEATSSIARLLVLLERYRSTIIAMAAGNAFPERTEGLAPSARSDEKTSSDWHLPPLPDGWAWRRVDEVGEVRLGRQRSPTASVGAPLRSYLRVANVHEDRIDFDDVLQMPFTDTELDRYRLISGDLLLNEGQSPELVGRPAVYRGDIPDLCFQNTLIRFRSAPGISSGFALLVFRHYFRSGRFTQIARWTTNLAHLGAERFAAMPFPLPSLAEQEQRVVEADQTLRTVGDLEEKLNFLDARLRFARHEVLARAFSGNLVPAGTTTLTATPLLGSHWERKARRAHRRPKATDGAGNKMQPISIAKALQAGGGELTPEQLFEATGLTEDNISLFFESLRDACRSGEVKEHRRGELVLLILSSKDT